MNPFKWFREQRSERQLALILAAAVIGYWALTMVGIGR